MALTDEAKIAYIEAFDEMAHELRRQKVPLVGINWWPLFETIQWDYREKVNKPLVDFIYPGSWNNGLYKISSAAKRHTETVSDPGGPGVSGGAPPQEVVTTRLRRDPPFRGVRDSGAWPALCICGLLTRLRRRLHNKTPPLRYDLAGGGAGRLPVSRTQPVLWISWGRRRGTQVHSKLSYLGKGGVYDAPLQVRGRFIYLGRVLFGEGPVDHPQGKRTRVRSAGYRHRPSRDLSYGEGQRRGQEGRYRVGHDHDAQCQDQSDFAGCENSTQWGRLPETAGGHQ